MAPQFLRSLRGLRVQLLLWTVLPLTLLFVGVTIFGITGHQSAMRTMVEELNARSARLAAIHLSEMLAQRVTVLSGLADRSSTITLEIQETFFDGGYAIFDQTGSIIVAEPSVADWQARQPDLPSLSGETISTPFLDPVSGRYSILITHPLPTGATAAGIVSLDQLGLAEMLGPERLQHPGPNAGGTDPAGQAVAYLVDQGGRVIYHPDPSRIGQDLAAYTGVQAALAGQAGAAYQQEPGGQDLAIGYAPIPETGWQLIVQEPWENLIAPMMRFSLLTPLAVIVAALVSGLAVSFGLHYIIRPLQTLDRQATRLAWGDFAAVAEQEVGGVQEIEDLRRTLAGMADQVRRYQSGMRDYIAAITHAQETERQRLARELHDETIQSLIALSHRIDMVQRELDRNLPKARQRLEELRLLTDDTQQEVRRFSRALRPLYLEDLGFVPALEMLAQETERQHNLSVNLSIEGAPRRLPPDLELAVYRMAQEGLSNVVRHAQASTVSLTVIFAARELVLRIADDGCGFTPPINPAELAGAGHFGLMGLHERALLFGGRLAIQSTPGQGTILEIHLTTPKVV